MPEGVYGLPRGLAPFAIRRTTQVYSFFGNPGTFTLPFVPVAGRTLVLALLSTHYRGNTVAGGGGINWSRWSGRWYEGGNYALAEVWATTVGQSPTASITLNLTTTSGTDANWIVVFEISGLSGNLDGESGIARTSGAAGPYSAGAGRARVGVIVYLSRNGSVAFTINGFASGPTWSRATSSTTNVWVGIGPVVSSGASVSFSGATDNQALSLVVLR